MGVDCRIWLPRWADGGVACELAALSAGGSAKAQKREFRDSDGFSADVQGLSYEVPDHKFPDYVTVRFTDAHGDSRHFLYWHKSNESDYDLPDDFVGGGMLLPRSTPFWIAVGKRLVQTFGGQIDYSDSDSVYDDFVVRPEEALLSKFDCLDGNAGFLKRQSLLLETKPLSPAELEDANRHAAYNLDGADFAALIAPYLAFHEEALIAAAIAPAPEKIPPRKRKVL